MAITNYTLSFQDARANQIKEKAAAAGLTEKDWMKRCIFDNIDAKPIVLASDDTGRPIITEDRDTGMITIDGGRP